MSNYMENIQPIKALDQKQTYLLDLEQYLDKI
jgi:hypothetical protein